MDDATSRTRPPSRRMASAKTASPRRSSPGRNSTGGADPEVSPARWAGVAFVIAAIVAAIALAMVSPGEPATPQAAVLVDAASPSAAPVTLDERKPLAQPRIVNPVTETTRELVIPVTVEVPADEIPSRLLELHIMRGDEQLKTESLRKLGTDTTVVVQGVSLSPGVNELTAVLDGPGGWGPRSEPVLLTVDRTQPELAITAPENKLQTYDDTVVVAGTAEVGAEVLVRNVTANWENPASVGGSGTFEVSTRLKNGANRIEVTSTDRAGVPRTRKLRITKLDGTPQVTLKTAKSIRRSDLPKNLRVVVIVKDKKGKPMEGAEVNFTLSARDRTTEQETLYTNADGRAVWDPLVEPSSSIALAMEVSAKVTSPYSDDTATRNERIDLQ